MMATITANLWMRLICVALTVSPAFAGDRPQSDDEKKTAVYQMYRDYKSEDFPEVMDISPKKAMALMSSGEIVFVDTRKTAEMEVSMLPGAVARSAFLDDVDRYQDKMIVAYCTISYRSGEFAEEMADRGVTVYNLEGGMLAWVLEGGKVYDEEGETRRIHVYGDKWNYAPAGYEAITFGFFERLF
jgi:sodium/bile acid cotransporter 7